MSSPRSETPSTLPERRAVARAGVVPHGKPELIGDALERLRRVAERAGVELVEGDAVDLAVVLGGDGTMLRALHRFLGTDVPAIGVNFGRVGFLTSVPGAELESGLEAVFAGAYDVLALPTIEVGEGDAARVGINDIVLASGLLGRMVVLDYAVDDEPLGELGCDGAILATPTGSTAYNLSAGGPVLAWGTDSWVLSFVSPHSLHARSLVLGRPHSVRLANRTPDVPVHVIVDGHVQAELPPGAATELRMGARCANLARLTGKSFFSRYRETFSH